MFVICVPKEIKNNEYRVGLTPEAAANLMRTFPDTKVVVESGAGEGSGYADNDYKSVGAEIAPPDLCHFPAFTDAPYVVIKVKEPQPSEFDFLLFPTKKAVAGFFHFPANPALQNFVVKNGISCLPYEDVEDDDGARPVLGAMSKIAGELAVLEGFHHLSRASGGLGLMPYDARVTIIGAGKAGIAAVRCALNLRSRALVILEKRESVLRTLRTSHPETFTPIVNILSCDENNLRHVLPKTDLLISATASRGEPAPKILSRDMMGTMQKGSVFVDIAIDEGGSSETSRQTSHENPVYKSEGVVHYCVPNMPGIVPRTASQALSAAALPYIKRFLRELAE